VAGGGGGPHYQNASIGTAVCGGGLGAAVTPGAGAAGAANTGGGGGGGNGSGGSGGNGGSGILVVSHPTALTNVCVANTTGGTDANVVGLWHFDQMTADNAGRHDGTIGGNTAFSSAQNAFTGGGGSFNQIGRAATDIFSYPGFNIAAANGDFTAEWWWQPTAVANSTQVWWSDAGTNTVRFAYNYVINPNGVEAANSAGGSGRSTTFTFVNGTWYHIAYQRASNVGTWYINGNAGTMAGTTWTTAVGSASTQYWLSQAVANLNAVGFIDEARLSNSARYTANFTPNTQPFCDPVLPQVIASNISTSGSTTFTAPLTAPIFAGDLVVIGVGGSVAAPVTINSVSDGTNTYVKAVSQQCTDTDCDTGIWYKENAAAVSTGTNITVTYSTAPNASAAIYATRYPNGLTSGSLDVTNKSAGTTVPCSVASGTLASANEYVFAYSHHETAATPYLGAVNFAKLANGSANSNSQGHALDVATPTSTTSITYTPSWTSPGTIRNACLTAAFKRQ